ncbi:MAG TPA: hypothetical protein VHF02_04105 [Luteimonas sp.]|nr:hypothetical protein [Luteimonas sp.]
MHSTHKFKTEIALVLSLLLAPAAAQQTDAGAWSLDPSVLSAGGDLLLRAPDREIDGLFQAVHAAAQSPNEAQALCGLFDPQADRSLTGLNAVASRLRPDSQTRFANAVANVLVAAMQSSPQPYDAAAARQSLKAAGVTAAILHDGFIAGLNADGNDSAARTARCQSLRWMLDAVQTRPQTERAAMTRLLLDEGLTRLDYDHTNATRP